MKLPSEHTNITLDDLLGLVETAIGTIERLQTENAFLARQLHESEDAANRAAVEANSMAAHIKELERTAAALKTNAEWRIWFIRKYGTSTFFTHIEKEYLQDHPPIEPVDNTHAVVDFASNRAMVRPGMEEVCELHEMPQGA